MSSTTFDPQSSMTRKQRLPIRVIYRDPRELPAMATLDSRKPKRRWHRHPLLALVLSGLVASFCGIVVHPRSFVIAAMALTIALLGALLPWASLRWVQGVMVYPRRRAQVGKEYTLRVRLQNGWIWPVYGLLIRSGWDSSGSDDRSTLIVAQLPGRQETEITWNLIPRQRGVYPISDPTIASNFPFGFYEMRKRMKGTAQVLVWPEIIPLPPVRNVVGRMVLGDAVNGSRAGTAGDLTGVRPYQRGESLRKVHWAQTARHDQLIVCERSDPAAKGLLVMLEAEQVVYRYDDPSGWERVVSIMASIAAMVVEGGGRASLVLGVGKVHEIHNSASLTPVFDVLARLQPGFDGSLSGLFRMPECRSFEGMTQLVVTTPEGFLRLDADQVNRPLRKFLLIDDHRPWEADPLEDRRPLKPGICIVPVDDPDHQQLLKAWKDLFHEV